MNFEIIGRVARTLFWACLVFALVMALLPHPPALVGDTSDKVQHMMAFAVLTLLAVLAFREAPHLTILLSLAFVGAAIEILQMIPVLHRDAEFADWLADCAAVLSVLAISAAVRRLSR